MAKNKTAKIVTKKHLARLERERRQARLITYSALAIVVVVISLIIYGILSITVLQARQPIVKVGKDVVTTREFQMRVRLARQQNITQYVQYLQFAQMFGMDPVSNPNIAQYLTQIQDKLNDPAQLGGEVINQLVDELLIRQYAGANGILVTADEIEKAIQSDFGFLVNDTLTPTLTPTAILYSTLSPTQLALVTLTPVPSLDPTSTPLPTATADPSAALRAGLSATPTTVPSITPTATPYTMDAFQSEFAKVVENYAKIKMTEADIRKVFFENRLYHQKVYDIITKDVPHEDEQVWARHILLADETTAQAVLKQLANGADWQTVAAENSKDTGTKDSGGNLGWFGRGKMIAEFENAAFALPIGKISQPVQSDFGWHIIQVIGHENRPLTEAEYQQLRDAKFQEWLAEARKATSVKIYDYYLERIPTDPKLEDELAKFQ
ncbi:MAG: peptidylprolyl isomerase [Anaerolineales bacterium]|nr:peptidylprolyl isomerase [Anaerolineales bacterium]